LANVREKTFVELSPSIQDKMAVKQLIMVVMTIIMVLTMVITLLITPQLILVMLVSEVVKTTKLLLILDLLPPLVKDVSTKL
jgi:uncharacterized membrane protein